MLVTQRTVQMRKYEESLPLKLLKAREVTMNFFRPVLQEIPLTEQQWRVIRALAEHKELESKQLADLCCILSPSLTGIINRLEQQGYIKRRRSSDDQRRILISLTIKAKEMFEVTAPLLEERYQQITEQFTEENLVELSLLLNKLSKLQPSK